MKYVVRIIGAWIETFSFGLFIDCFAWGDSLELGCCNYFLRGTARLSINVIGSQEHALRRYNWIFLKRAVRDILILCLQKSS